MESLSLDSRVWIYQSNQLLSETQCEEIERYLKVFTKEWTAHNHQLSAVGGIFYQRFIVLMVDETRVGASGCSIDKSVRFIQGIGREFGIDLLDRLTFAYLKNDEVKTASKDEFKDLFQNGELNEDTLIFDNLVKTKREFEESWVKPLKDSWHKKMV